MSTREGCIVPPDRRPALPWHAARTQLPKAAGGFAAGPGSDRRQRPREPRNRRVSVKGVYSARMELEERSPGAAQAAPGAGQAAPAAAPVSPRWVAGRAVRLLAALVAGVTAGALIAGAQSWLPADVTQRYANAGGPWVLISFLVALAAPGVAWAIASGFACMAGLVAGFFLASALHSLPPSGSPGLWMSAAMVFGPLTGLAAGWVRFGPPPLAATAAGGIAGILAGEAVTPQVRSGPYWPVEAIAGLGLLAGLLAWRCRSPGPQRSAAWLWVTAVALIACLAAAALTVGAARSSGFF
jgi:Family of unknown function (DUF6518)